MIDFPIMTDVKKYINRKRVRDKIKQMIIAMELYEHRCTLLEENNWLQENTFFKNESKG